MPKKKKVSLRRKSTKVNPRRKKNPARKRRRNPSENEKYKKYKRALSKLTDEEIELLGLADLAVETNVVYMAIDETRKLKLMDDQHPISPEIYEVDTTSYPGFILVDVTYDTDGHRALWEYHIASEGFMLAQS